MSCILKNLGRMYHPVFCIRTCLFCCCMFLRWLLQGGGTAKHSSLEGREGNCWQLSQVKSADVTALRGTIYYLTLCVDLHEWSKWSSNARTKAKHSKGVLFLAWLCTSVTSSCYTGVRFRQTAPPLNV